MNIKNKIMVLSGKGGVGKSTVAVNLAYGLAGRGLKVGLLDADMHGPSVAKMTGTESFHAAVNADSKIIPIQIQENLTALSVAYLLEKADSAIIWRGPMKMGVLKEMIENTDWGTLDYLIVDCPPGTGDEPLSVAQLLHDVDGAIIVSTSQDLAIVDVRKSVDFVKQLNIPIIGIVENMSYIKCPNCSEKIKLYEGEGITKMLMDFDLDLLAELPFDRNITTSGDSGEAFIDHFKQTETGKLMESVVDKVIQALES